MTQFKDYDSMSDSELRRYFLEHRDDESFHAYMDRRHARPNRTSISPNDPQWQQKVIASIKKQLGEVEVDGNPQS